MDIFENLHALQNSTESKIPDNMEAIKEDINYLPSRYIERLSVAAVRDFGLRSCQATPKFERGRMLELPLKPLLLLHFVMGRLYYLKLPYSLIKKLSICSLQSS